MRKVMEKEEEGGGEEEVAGVGHCWRGARRMEEVRLEKS